jgi:glutaredoxin 3
MKNSKVTVYTMDYCPFCEQAKTLLKKRGVEFQEVRVAMDDDNQWETLYKRTGLRTMPQIFHGEEVIGGYTDLAALDQKQGLEHLK